MTCVVAIRDKDTVHIGADSLGSNGVTGINRNDKKIFRYKDLVLGFTTSYRMGQILMYDEKLLDELSVMKEEITHKYMVTKFVPHLVDIYKKNGYEKKYNDGELKGGNFIIGYKDRLWSIEEDFQVEERKDNFTACGSGTDLALGSLDSTNGNPKERIKKALRTASKYVLSVGGDLYYTSTKQDKIDKL